jgi:RNA polymerase sigma-70 factor (ECF subfamily)
MEFKPDAPGHADAWTGGWPQSPQEFSALLDAYLDRLVRYAFRLLGNVQDAEDVVQEVLVRAFTERSKRKSIAAVCPYLFRSVANACTDFLRKRSYAAVFREEIGIAGCLGGGKNPCEIAANGEALRRAEQLLGRLPEAQAEVIRLRVFDELRLSEIAEVVGCSVNTVCSRLRYGFRKLRNLVGEKWE